MGGSLAVPADESDSLDRGTLLGGSYRVLGKRAAGGMGEIYLASHTRWRGRFAVKVLPSRLREDPKALARFGEEAKMLGLVQHANVVRLLDFDTRGAQGPFLAMEYVEGMDLAHHISERGLVSPQRAGQIVEQIAAALEAAHARRIVHGDIKPGNVMLTDGPEPAVKVVDFGVAHPFGHLPSLGTPAYMAPEQAQGRAEDIDSRADQFALAALSYELLSGDDPFPGDSTLEVLAKLLHGRPKALARRVSWSAEAAESVLERALSKRPAERYASVSEFAAELGRALVVARERSTSMRVSRLDGIPPPFPTRRELARTLPDLESRRDYDLVTAARRGHQTTVPVRSVGCRGLVA
jgi:eukaryotic-like serine/threonine-protein kinase